MYQVSLPQIELLLKVLRFFGLWQPETTAMKVRGFLAQLVFLLISVVFPLINYFYFNGNLENVGVHMALYFATNLKIRILIWQMDDFVEHMDNLKDLMEFTKSDNHQFSGADKCNSLSSGAVYKLDSTTPPASRCIHLSDRDCPSDTDNV
jgi:hypothetical protein